VSDAGVSMNNPFFCYTTDPIRSMTYMHSTQTSYEAIRRFNFTTVNPTISTCTPSRISYLGRYGGRFPFTPTFRSMIDFVESSIQADIASNYEAGRTTLCRQDFEAIRNWTKHPDFIIENSNQNTEASVIAIQNIARRFQRNYPNILTETYSHDRFHFRHNWRQRSNDSIRAFAAALFGEAEAQNVIFEDVPENDFFLRPIDFCPEFTELTANQSEQAAFRQGPEFEQLTEEINRKLGFRGSNQLSVDYILIMWDWCRFETSFTFELSNSETGGESPWCAPFSMSHHRVLEYYYDLGWYYGFGYGVRNQRLVENLNCGLLQDLLIHMQSDDDTDQKARIFMTYLQESQMMLVALGAFRDTWPLHQHNFAQQSARHWSTSVITPFGANLVVVRHDCDDGDHDLVFLLNERPILVPGCDQQSGVCKLSFILNRFERFIGANCETFFCSSN